MLTILMYEQIEIRGAVPKGCNSHHVKYTKFEATHSGLAQLSMSYYVIEVSSACSLSIVGKKKKMQDADGIVNVTIIIINIPLINIF